MQASVRSRYSELSTSSLGSLTLVGTDLQQCASKPLFLHRGFFAQALTDNPTNPLQSAHSQSFVTAYKCACAVLDVTRNHYVQRPRLVARVWRIWSNAFVAAVGHFA
jgi:hypothetical protein